MISSGAEREKLTFFYSAEAESKVWRNFKKSFKWMPYLIWLKEQEILFSVTVEGNVQFEYTL